MHVEAGSRRALAYVIDILFVGLLLMCVSLVAGHSMDDMPDQISRPIFVVYMLLKDVGGASVGKFVLGLRVRSTAGANAPLGARIVRNIPLALAALVAGRFVGNAAQLAGSAVMVIEYWFVAFLDGRRLGDRLAGTVVVNRVAQAPLERLSGR